MKNLYTLLLFSGTATSVSAQWNLFAQMSDQRTQHIAVTLNSGEVLVAGGWNFTSHLLTAEIYSPAGDVWSNTVNDMTSAHSTGAAVKLSSGKVLVTGGYNGASNVTNCDLYDHSLGSWSAAHDMMYARSYHTATLLNDGRVLVAGGYNGSVNLPVCELYDPATNTWTQTDSLLTGRSYHTATLLSDGKVLVTGGYNPSAGFQLNSAEIYDPVTETWSSVSNMNDARSWHAASLLANGKVLVTGGEHYTGELAYAYEGLKTAEVFDPLANTWTGVSDMPGGLCYNHQFTMAGNKVLVVSGLAKTNYSPTFESTPGFTYLYYADSDNWGIAAMYLDGRIESSGDLMNDGRVIVTGGNDQTVEIYQQPLSVNENENILSDMLVFPNPGNGIFTINLNSGEKIDVLEVYDLAGQQVYSGSHFNAAHAQIDLTGHAEGIYTIKVTSGKNTGFSRISLVK